MKLRHPSRNALRDWLDAEFDASIDDHVHGCERCASLLEAIESEHFNEHIGDALAAALSPPDGLVERLEKRVLAKLDTREMMGLVADLFGAGWETSKMLIVDEVGEADTL